MVLTTQNVGKYLSESWHEDRLKALTDSSNFSSDDLEYLEVTASINADENRDSFMIDTNPVDSLTLAKVDAIDIRKFPQNGGL